MMKHQVNATICHSYNYHYTILQSIFHVTLLFSLFSKALLPISLPVNFTNTLWAIIQILHIKVKKGEVNPKEWVSSLNHFDNHLFCSYFLLTHLGTLSTNIYLQFIYFMKSLLINLLFLLMDKFKHRYIYRRGFIVASSQHPTGQPQWNCKIDP